MMRKKWVSVLAYLAVIALVCGCGRSALEDFAGPQFSSGENLITEEETGQGGAVKEEAVPAAGEIPELLCVDISGAVVQPGVYTLPEGSRVIDAVEAASGLKPEADLKRINQAKGLTDGEKIIVYEVGETVSETDWLPGQGAEVSVNINTADMNELETLSGIGEVKARAIVEDRERNGAYQEPGDIMRVSGIGEKLFDRIRGEITV